MATDLAAPRLGRRRGLPSTATRLGQGIGGTLAVTKHWLCISARDRKFAITATLIPLNYLFLFLITVINGNSDPTASWWPITDRTRGRSCEPWRALTRSV